MVINYKQLREKREQVKESFRRNEDLTPLVRLAQGIVDAYEISLELPSQTWTDSDGNRQHYVSCGLEAAEGFRRMPLSVPLKEGNSPYTTVCEAIQYYVLSEIDNLKPDGTQKMVQLW